MAPRSSVRSCRSRERRTTGGLVVSTTFSLQNGVAMKGLGFSGNASAPVLVAPDFAFLSCAAGRRGE
jgi:hypothetical protein